MRISIILLFFFLSVSSVYGKQEQAQNTSIVDPGQQEYSDKESLIISRIYNALLAGNIDLMITYYKSAILSFMAEDKQTQIINFSLNFLPKLILYQKLELMQDIINHLYDRIEYFSKAPESKKDEWRKTLEWYKILSILLKKEYNIPINQNVDITQEVLLEDSPPSMLKVLQYLSLALNHKEDKEKTLEYMYTALNTSNLLYSTEMYYVVSYLLIKFYLESEDYSNAIIRLNTLYKLFSTVEPSDFFRIKVLILFTKVFLEKDDKKTAYTTYLRAKEMITYNNNISQQEKIEIENTLKNIEKLFPEEIKANYKEGIFLKFLTQN